MKKEFTVDRQGKTFALYAGLLDEAHAYGLKAIRTTLIQVPNEANGNVAICHASVETDRGTFEGIGDASPANVARHIVPHIIRMAETRAKARALRDAVNVSMVTIEETEDDEPDSAPAPATNGHKPATKPSPTIEQARAAYATLAEELGEKHVNIPRPGQDTPAEQIVEWGKFWRAMQKRCNESGVFLALLADWTSWASQAQALNLPFRAIEPAISDLDLRNAVADLSKAVTNAQKPAPKTVASAPQTAAQPATSGPTATPAQVKAIYVIAKSELQWTEGQTASYAQSRYGAHVEALSKADASKLIDELKAKAQEGGADEVAL